MFRAVLSFAAAVLIASAAQAQAQAQESSGASSQEMMASAAEKTTVLATIAKIGCKADAVEKENADLFEVDDAQCEIGRYDIKLDGKFSIVSVTRD